MNNTCRALLIAAVAALVFHTPGVAYAQTYTRTIPVALQYTEPPVSRLDHSMALAFGRKDEGWLFVLAVVVFVAVIVIASFANSFGNINIFSGGRSPNHRSQSLYSPPGIDIWRSGPLSFGVNPLSQPGLVDKVVAPRMGLYLTANFRF